jgi:hypothetical protein
MIVNATLKLNNGSVSFQDEGKDLDVIQKVATLANPRIDCLCKQHSMDNKTLESRKAKDFTFVSFNCSGCRAKSGLGQYKTGGYFWKEYEVYTPNRTDEDLAKEYSCLPQSVRR